MITNRMLPVQSVFINQTFLPQLRGELKFLNLTPNLRWFVLEPESGRLEYYLLEVRIENLKKLIKKQMNLHNAKFATKTQAPIIMPVPRDF